ncbi:MAG: DUF1367 family protein [Candidatus Accumulibacter sp.]|nr:DUF1367 family protein [Accumulibacter sp.]
MSDLVITKGDDGKLRGMGEAGERAYAKWRKAVEALQPGETLRFQWWMPRSPRHHGLFFAKLSALHAMQEQFEDVDRLRQWLTVGAGYCAFVPGPTGRMVALPQSIAWHRLDEAEFSELHGKVDQFLWTDHARRFLWPHLSDQQSYAMVETLMQEFNR